MTERGRQVIRQWRILLLLEQRRSWMSVAELHAALEEDCHERTVRRDLEQLSAAGFPITESKGRWRVLEPREGGWMVPVEPTELLVIALAEDLFGHLRGSWLADPLAQLRAKLLAIMPPRGREFFERLRRLSVATLFAPGELDGRGPLLQTLMAATNERRVLRVRYQKPRSDPEVRDIEPLMLWFHDGVVRVIAHCRKAQDVRQFVAQRVLAAEMLAETFTPPADFDPDAYVRAAFGSFHGPNHDVAIDFGPAVAHLVTERRYHHTQVTSPTPGGGTRLTMRAAGLPEIAAWVAGYGGEARPVAPPELVAAVRQLHVDGLAALGEARGAHEGRDASGPPGDLACG